MIPSLNFFFIFVFMIQGRLCFVFHVDPLARGNLSCPNDAAACSRERAFMSARPSTRAPG